MGIPLELSTFTVTRRSSIEMSASIEFVCELRTVAVRTVLGPKGACAFLKMAVRASTFANGAGIEKEPRLVGAST